jgi:magnesium-transporting ATPase (P-type)
LSESEFEDWIKTYEQASASIVNRDDLLAACAENIERDCFVIGATAVEDKLQEGVPETIETLRNAGLLVWMLTGDKLENRGVHRAHVSIDRQGRRPGGGARGGFRERQRRTGSFLKKKAAEAREDASLGSSFGLVIEGGALAHALLDKHINDFLDLCDACVGGVVCCRVSPIQKAAVCEAMKRREGRVVLGIGDGANDVGPHHRRARRRRHKRQGRPSRGDGRRITPSGTFGGYHV